MTIILFGAPGAGKGTQGELAAERFGMVRLSTGDLLRAARQQGTRLGLEAKKFMDAGELVPDSVILGMVREVMENGTGSGFIFDGFPRTAVQAEGLATLLTELGQTIDSVIVLNVEDEVLVRRLAGRLYCPNCGALYNRYSEPPRDAGKCDRCGGELQQRKDDEEETVRRRLEVYREQTEPVLAFYERNGTPIHQLRGDRSIDEVQNELAGLLSR